MGFPIKMNWVLQIEPPKELELNVDYEFKKRENRVFPLETPIDLINGNREAIAKIQVNEYTNKSNITTGIYRVLKIYSEQEKRVLTQYWIENQ